MNILDLDKKSYLKIFYKLFMADFKHLYLKIYYK